MRLATSNAFGAKLWILLLPMSSQQSVEGVVGLESVEGVVGYGGGGGSLEEALFSSTDGETKLHV